LAPRKVLDEPVRGMDPLYPARYPLAVLDCPVVLEVRDHDQMAVLPHPMVLFRRELIP